jgi:four helix bundle suffix protein
MRLSAKASLGAGLISSADWKRLSQEPTRPRFTDRLPLWGKDSKEARFVRKLGANPDSTYADYREFVETRPAGVEANIAICLIHQANFLLDRLIARLEQDFIKEGGIRERMARARLRSRQNL